MTTTAGEIADINLDGQVPEEKEIEIPTAILLESPYHPGLKTPVGKPYIGALSKCSPKGSEWHHLNIPYHELLPEDIRKHRLGDIGDIQTHHSTNSSGVEWGRERARAAGRSRSVRGLGQRKV